MAQYHSRVLYTALGPIGNDSPEILLDQPGFLTARALPANQYPARPLAWPDATCQVATLTTAVSGPLMSQLHSLPRAWP